jgi:hypothetical protein
VGSTIISLKMNIKQKTGLFTLSKNLVITEKLLKNAKGKYKLIPDILNILNKKFLGVRKGG